MAKLSNLHGETVTACHPCYISVQGALTLHQRVEQIWKEENRSMASRLSILLSNDDGVMAPGLQALYDALSHIATVTVVAPEAERSGASSGITITRPLRAVQLPNGFWSVDGTPADCVYLALNGLLPQKFDLLVSGINSGANLGDDVLYSGTVGAAREGRLMSLPAIAVSLVGGEVRNYTHAGEFRVAAEWVQQFVAAGVPSLPPRHVLNINIPDVPVLSGWCVTRMGHRQAAHPIQPVTDPRGRQVYWIGLSGDRVRDQGQRQTLVGTDFEAIEAGQVSITPIQMDATAHAQLHDLQVVLQQKNLR